jgi:hypothetical protein
MSDWLEEAEKRARHDGLSQGQSERFQVIVDRIQENYEKNQKVYDDFVRFLIDLVKRANSLPQELKPTFSKIDAIPKPTKLNNQLYIFSSSRHSKQRKPGFFSFLKPVHIKNVRVFYISVSRQLDKIDLELKESKLERKRKRIDSKNSLPHSDKDRVDIVFHYPMDKLDHEFANKALDWLAYKSDLEELPLDFENAQVY